MTGGQSSASGDQNPGFGLQRDYQRHTRPREANYDSGSLSTSGSSIEAAEPLVSAGRAAVAVNERILESEMDMV